MQMPPDCGHGPGVCVDRQRGCFDWSRVGTWGSSRRGQEWNADHSGPQRSLQELVRSLVLL